MDDARGRRAHPNPSRQMFDTIATYGVLAPRILALTEDTEQALNRVAHSRPAVTDRSARAGRSLTGWVRDCVTRMAGLDDLPCHSPDSRRLLGPKNGAAVASDA
jgi:hypothetical protein